jgi:multiple sugar transport system permease protein
LDFPRFFFNSAVIALAVTVGTLVFCPMLGYALAKLRWHGKGLIMGLVLATLMVPAGITLIPNFILMSNLGLVNTYPGLILPFLAGPFGVFLMRQFMLGVPNELLEAARMDGANEFKVFFSVVMPIATPVLATLAILTFLGNWNSFLYPLVMSQEPGMYTLPVALATFATGQYQADHGMLMAGSVVLVIPVLIVFVLFQRWITEGIATTGLKG